MDLPLLTHHPPPPSRFSAPASAIPTLRFETRRRVVAHRGESKINQVERKHGWKVRARVRQSFGRIGESLRVEVSPLSALAIPRWTGNRIVECGSWIGRFGGVVAGGMVLSSLSMGMNLIRDKGRRNSARRKYFLVSSFDDFR